MNWIISYIAGVLFIIGCAISHYRGYNYGHADGEAKAQKQATHRFKHDALLFGRN